MSEQGKESNSEPNEIIPNKNEVKNDKMKDALTAIANEMLKLQDPTHTSSSPTNVTGIEDILNKLVKTKSSLTFKRKLIIKLKDKVKTACTVAQAAISAGENESTSLNGHLHVARTEYAELYQKHRQTSQIIQSMTKENKVLRDELQKICNVVTLGYNELQKIHNECLSENLATQQLKQIILCCGQYYAEYNNEKEKNLQLDQKNRFLNNKISILNNSLEAISEDLKNLRRQNVRLQNENNFLKEDKEKLKPKYIVPISLECDKKYQNNYVNTTRTKNDIIRRGQEIDVTVHLSIVKKLLRDQDDLLKDLKSLSKQITIEQTIDIQPSKTQ